MELEIIRWLRERLPTTDRVTLGPGDDAAVVSWEKAPASIIACDTIAEGLDFILDDCTLEQVGHKALGINLSDLAAMAAHPVAATVSLILPQKAPLATCKGITEGMISLADRYSIALVGGDVTIWDGPLVVTVNVIGEPGPHGTWRRAGAVSGDALLVTGNLGGSIRGHHLDFEPRIKESQELAAKYEIKAAIDISDGLAIDTTRLASESGLGVILHLDGIPVAEAAHALSRDTSDTATPLEHALGDGEDFELLFAVNEAQVESILADKQLGCPVAYIGTFVEDRGLWTRDKTGQLTALPATGYLHGAQ